MIAPSTFPKMRMPKDMAVDGNAIMATRKIIIPAGLLRYPATLISMPMVVDGNVNAVIARAVKHVSLSKYLLMDILTMLRMDQVGDVNAGFVRPVMHARL